MATHTLTTDTLISTLMPSGGGTLASGDTIQLAGHSLIVDADAVDYPVTIANFGADSNLELRDGGRIKLSATLSATVHPWIDPAHPLPVSAEPGIDGDPYRTPLTANARVEIQLAGNFSLGGGKATLPTEVRSGNWCGKSNSYPATNQIEFDREMNLHAGDYIFDNSDYRNPALKVTAYDVSAKTATLESAMTYRTPGSAVCVCGGGVMFRNINTGASSPMFTSDVEFGAMTFWGGRADCSVFSACGAKGQRFVGRTSFAAGLYQGSLLINGACAKINDVGFWYMTTYRLVGIAGHLDCDTLVLFALGNGGTFSGLAVSCEHLVSKYISFGSDGGVGQFAGPIFSLANIRSSEFERANTTVIPPITNTSFVDFCGTVIVHGGTVVRQENGSFYHAPATAADVTWRYNDRTVPPGATLRLRCAWLRVGTAPTRASVAVTAAAMWWPQLWPLGVDALASVEFTGGTSDWRSELLTWRNTGTEAVQVRVWECVTGTVAGGYLKVEEVKGGQL